MPLFLILSLSIIAVLLGSHSASSSEPGIKIDLTITLPDDDGLPQGSLFELVDRKGIPVMGAGFGYSNNTNLSSNNKVLTVFTGVGDPANTRLIDLGRPYEAHSTFGLFVLDDQLVAKPTGSSPPPLVFDVEQQRWQPLDFPLDASVASVRVVENKALVLQALPMRLLFDGVEIVGEERWAGLIGRSVNYVDGYLYVNTDDREAPSDGAMLVCPWKPGQAQISDCASHDLNEPSFYYTVFPGRFPGTAVFANSLGDNLEISYQAVAPLRVNDGKAYQLYSSLAYRDVYLAGHYPTGNVFEFGTDRQGAALSPPVGRQECSSPDEREAQSLAIYSGQAVTGMWPFGEVWQKHPVHGWQVLKRVFSEPEPCGIAPFHQRARDQEDVYNVLGQRIYGFANWRHGLAVATSLKGEGGEKALDMLSDQETEDYGRVFLLDNDRELSCEIVGTGQMRITIDVSGTELTISKDQQEICSREIVVDPLDLTGADFSAGNGPWGPFKGEILSLDVDYSR